MRLLLPLLLVSIATLRAEQPFEFNSTPGKLPKQVVPQEYAVRIIPSLTSNSFTGSETAKLEVRAPVHELVLNAAEMQLSDATLDRRPLTVVPNEEQQTVTLRSEAEIPAGIHMLALNFAGKINERGAGLFAMKYQEQGTGAAKVMLGTQFEPADARRLFPCWDEPSFRARFQLTAVIPPNWTAISNMPVEHEEQTPNGKEVRFAASPSMASYLNVFVAGELDIIESKVGTTTIRVVTSKGKGEMGRYALEATAQILKFYNDYFGVAYPLPKLDQIAIPGGFGGAMENWGGITYYESALLFDPQNSSSETKQSIYSVIAHEMAHQWFGDLVTMAWWDNLWLNEGFASWMGSKCTAKFNPQWEVWNHRGSPRDPSRRHGIPKEVAMEGDARSTTHPIQQTIKTEAEANSAFDDITYQKGQSFLRMLESFLGEDVFRDGLRRYMQAHKYSNSTTADLWKALSDASGKPVAEIATAWTQQPGFPLVEVRRDASGKLSLNQQRFAVNFANPPPEQWPIPLTYFALGTNKPATLLMTNATAEITGISGKQTVKLNAGSTGYHRVQYDGETSRQLLGALAKLTPADRVNLLGDTWALVQANRASFGDFAQLVSKLQASLGFADTEEIITVFDFINRLLAGTPQREQFQRYARSVLRSRFDQLGWEPKTNEPPAAATLRASLIQMLGDLNDPQIVAGCRERLQKFVSDRAAVPADLRKPVLAVAMRYGDEATWEKLHELGLKTTSIEEKGIVYDALATALDPKLAEKTLAISLTDELPTSRAVFLVARVARGGEHPDEAWAFAKAHMNELLTKTDALGGVSFSTALFTFFSDPARLDELQAYAKDLPPSAAPQVAKATDELSFRAEFKQRLLAQLPAVVSQSKPAK